MNYDCKFMNIHFIQLTDSSARLFFFHLMLISIYDEVSERDSRQD
jgi:hypothetical protein